MIYNRYKGIRKYFGEYSFPRKVFYVLFKPYLKYVENRFEKKLPLFSHVEIETINRCNGECSFCPVNRNEEKRKFAQMSDELFDIIISQLGEIDYKDKLALFSNNEPFLDKKIIGRAKKAREKVPHAYLYLYTNGTLLNEDNVKEIMQYLDKMIIDNYSDGDTLNKESSVINNMCKKDSELDKKIIIFMRKQDEILYTRGGGIAK